VIAAVKLSVRSVVLLVAAALVLLPAQAHAAPLPLPTIPPPIKAPDPAPAGSAFDGDGMWIWYASKSSGGSPDAIAARAEASGIETVFLKSSDGANYWSQFNAPYVAALKARGLKVCAWQYVYGRRPVTEARAGRRAIEAGADCLVIDAEIEYEGRYAQASTYMRKLRAYAGDDYPIGLAGWPYVDYHPAYPLSVFLGPGGAQFNVPQMYWKAIGVSVDEVFAHTYLYNSLYGRPIAPLGQTYGRPKGSELARFRELAAAYGAPGLSWWSWQASSAGAWNALGRELTPLTAAIAPLPVAPLLKRGARGDMVVWAQQHLLAAAQTVRVNGRYDARTVRAVQAYQLASFLPVTGTLDVPTWQSLLAREPAAVRWRSGAGAGQPVPASAKLPARMREIPPKPH
jgi:Putative peptidoglycan binding domain